MRIFRWAIGLIIITACAREGFPPGGPEDRIPPKIIEASPQQNATHVPLSTRLEFVFSEKVDRASFEQAFFISPAPSGKELRFRWHGQRVEVVFPDSLRRRTYVATIGTDVRDLRNNRMERAFSLAFSTGDRIDTGEIRGRIFHERPVGILMLAYLLETGQEPDPSQDYADYLTQVGKDGEFVLPYLSEGRYRVFALEDRDGDRLYRRGEEAIGVPTRDVVVDSTRLQHADLNFRLTIADTLRPGLAAITAFDQIHLILRFDENVAPADSMWEHQLRILSPSDDSLLISAMAPHPLDLKEVHAITSSQRGEAYHAFFGKIRDGAGNLLDSLSRHAEFAGNPQPDTTQPRLIRILPADSSRHVALTAVIEMIFSEMIQSGGSTWPLIVQDSSGNSVAGKGVWLNPFQFQFQPDTLWRSRAQYVVKILADSIFDWGGNALFDTTDQITFWVVNADTLSVISGQFSDAQPDATGSIHLAARQLGAGSRPAGVSATHEYVAILREPGPYRIEQILPGLYQFRAFRDANLNGRFDFGVAVPFVPAERYFVWPDTIKVRSRWPNEGNDFILP